MHPVGFTVEIYYDARSYKRQTERIITRFRNVNGTHGVLS